MFEINFNKIINDLVSENFETQCIALEQVSDLSTVLAKQGVKALEVSQNPFLIAERLIKLGSIIVKPLESFIESLKECEKRTIASILLLQLGSYKGLKNVIAELENKGENEYLASRVLIEQNVPGVDNLIIDRLRKFSTEELQNEKTSIYVENLLSYLGRLNVALPSDLEEAFDKLINSPTYKYYRLQIKDNNQ